MNTFFTAIAYAALHRRITCSHCGSYDHHKHIGRRRFLCTRCRKEFFLDL